MATASPVEAPLRDEPSWPALHGARPVFLLDASSALEARILEAWIRRNRPENVAADGFDAVAIPPSRRRRRRTSLARLEANLASGVDCLLAPLRVAWLPKKRNGERSVRFSDVLRLGDPRDPGRLRQSFLLRRRHDRCRVVAGEPAPLSELRERWQRASGTDIDQAVGLADFVARQAGLALDLRGFNT